MFIYFQAITTSGNTVYMSDSAGSCNIGQTSTVEQSDGSGVVILNTTCKIKYLSSSIEK